MALKFYRCAHCGNIICFVENSGVPVMCCGQKMEEIIPGSVEAATEKHIPVISINDYLVKVNVGSVEHPMTEQHHISWIVLETQQGRQKKALAFDQKPEATFALAPNDKVLAAYAYCNLHGLWSAEA